MDSPLDDLDLVVAARRGDEDAFRSLIERHAGRLLRLARTITPEHAEDAVQETVLAAWKSLPTFRGDAAITTWLHTICTRQAMRFVDHRVVEALDAMAASQREWQDPDWTVNPAEVVAHAGLRDELDGAISRLPVVYRTALVLHDVEGLTALEVAKATAVPVGTAKSRIRRARMAVISELARNDGRLDAEVAG